MNFRRVTAVAVAAMAVTHTAVAQQFTVERVAPANLPAGLNLIGDAEAARRWTDRNGQNLLVLTRTPETWSTDRDDNRVRSREIHAYHFVRRGAGYRLLWQTNDFVRECDVDIVLDYASGSLR